MTRSMARPHATALALLLPALLTAPAVASPVLNLQREAQGLTLTWTEEGQLETASSVSGPWAVVPDARSPHRLQQIPGTRFFRVRQTFRLSVNRAGDGTGKVTAPTAGLDCGASCSVLVPAGDQVTLSAAPEAGSTFAGWTGDCTGTADCVVAMTAARNVTATFNRAAALNPIVNGDFEQGHLVGWAQAPGQLIFPANNLGGAQPHSGQYAAYLGFDQDSRRQVQLGQQVTLPNRTPLYLNFAAWLYSEELCDVPWYDRITLYVNGQAAFQNDRVCRGSGTDGWVRLSVDMSALAGQSAAIVFEVYSADALASVLLLDDIAIADQPWGQ